MDCVIPMHRKDAEPFRRCVAGLRRHVAGVGDIRVVTDPANEPLLADLDVEVTLVDEGDYRERLGFSPETRGDRPHEWILQQFIKLEAHRVVDTPQYLVVDADTVFLNPVDYRRGARTLFVCNGLYSRMDHPCCRDYCDTIERLLGWRPDHEAACFIAHQMVFSVEAVRSLLRTFPEQPWWRFIHNIGPEALYVKVAEYETYGHYVLRNQPEQVALETRPVWREVPWKWWGDEEATEDMLALLRAKGYWFATFHSFHRNVRLSRDEVFDCLVDTDSNEEMYYWLHGHRPDLLADDEQFPLRYKRWVAANPRPEWARMVTGSGVTR